MKKNNLLKVIGLVILLTVVLTWIIPTSYYSSGVVDNGLSQVGLFDLMSYLSNPQTSVLVFFGYISVFILAIGGFYGVLHKTNSYRVLLDRIVKKYKGTEWIFLTLSIVLFAFISSVSGLNIALLFAFPFVATVVLYMGYDKITAALVTAGATIVGMIGTTYSATVSEALNEASASTLALSVSSLIWEKLAILVLSVALLVFFVIKYSNKHKTAKVDEDKLILPTTKNKKAKIWPLVVIFDLTLLLMILGFISWESSFEITWFTELVTDGIPNFKIGGFAIFSKLLGSALTPFGYWQIYHLIFIVLIASVLVALFSRVKLDDFIEGFGKGAQVALKPAFLTCIIYLVLFISANHPFVLGIVSPILDLFKNAASVFSVGLATIISSLFSVELYYSASTFVPYLTSEVITNKDLYPAVALVIQCMYGFSMLVVPTSAILVATLSYLGISYTKWIKSTWKFLLGLLVLLVVALLIVMVI